LTIDDRSLLGLIEESQDLQVDAIKDARRALPDLADIRAERGNEPPAPERVRAFEQSRRDLLHKFGLAGGGGTARGLLSGGIGAAVAAILSKPVSAQENLDVQILNTASSLETLAVQTYDTALGLDFIKNGNPVIVQFARTTAMQHGEHNDAFNAQAVALGGQEQTEPNAQYAQVVSQTAPTLKAPLDVVKLAAQLEEVASDTYLTNLEQFNDETSLSLMGSVLGVEVQHLATLKAVQALLEADAPELVAIPTKLGSLPAAAGSAGFPDGAFLEAQTETVAAPGEGTR
jgi:rubrerythrin